MTDIHHLIAAISPDVYCDPVRRQAVKTCFRTGLKKSEPPNFLRAAEVARPREANQQTLEELEALTPSSLPGLKSPSEQHVLTFDSLEESLEGIYFWLLDRIKRREGWQAIKLVDSFAAAPGSGQFLDITRRLTRMQQDGAKLLTSGQAMVRTMLDTLKEIKEKREWLKHFQTYQSTDPVRKAAALISLKQIWLENVDGQRKTTALLNFGRDENLLGQFMQAGPDDAPAKEDDWPQKLLHQRVHEFFQWLQEGQPELHARLEIDRNQLRSQMETLKLYARWAKPYLILATALGQKTNSQVSLVTPFNTVLFELTLLAHGDDLLPEAIQRGDLPVVLGRMNLRTYHPVIIVELRFRSAPRQISSGAFAHRGQVEVRLTSYALQESELELLQQTMDRNETGEVISRLGLPAVESLEATLAEVDRLATDRPPTEEPDAPSGDTNPFGVLWELVMACFRWLTGKSVLSRPKPDLTPDSYAERMIRSQAVLAAHRQCHDLFEECKQKLQGLGR